ncbi:MAG TPA: hypothetical protein VFH17_06235 [Coriobacteriia bacterium]|nr:hypothetical protein [Coriobacteriia bacterium]
MTALARLKNWDYLLTVATVALLGSLGVQSFLGTAYVWWATYSVPGFQAIGYRDFIWWMNAIAAPQVVALVVLMGLCVPKRLLDRGTLIAVSAVMLVAGLAAWVATGSLATGLAVYLALAGLIQAAVVAITVAGARGPSYLTEGRLVKIGSGLLHLGFIAFAFVVVALQRSTFMLPAFWAATALTLVGTLLTFYASRFAWRGRVRVPIDRGLAEE